jgi:glycosyltransferase involved in cell wall biosynthesis
VHAASVEVEGMTILEAMGCGLPLLLADSPKSAAKQFALSRNSIYNCFDVNDLIGKIDFWVENPSQRKEARKAYADYAIEYRIENSYQKLVAQYYKYAKKRSLEKPSILNHSQVLA